MTYLPELIAKTLELTHKALEQPKPVEPADPPLAEEDRDYVDEPE
jgi:hypothetical protein